MAVPFIDLAAQRARIERTLGERIERVFAHGRFVFGPEITELEKALGEKNEVAHSIACANGTDALTLALRAEGVGNKGDRKDNSKDNNEDNSKGDCVFVPAFTFAAPAEAVLLCGATPFFVDIDENFTIAPSSLKRAIRDARAQGFRAKALVAVELYGLPADYDSLFAIAQEENLFFVIDAAQSLGARYRGRSTVSLGDVAITSFFPTKPLGAYGDGGALFTQDAERARLLRQIANHGQQTRYRHTMLGTNSRLDSLQAAVLLAKLTLFDEELVLRQKVASTYDSMFQKAAQRRRHKAELISLPRVPAERSCVWGQYTLLSPRRDAICESCAAAGVATLVHYPLALNDQEAFASCPVVSDGVAQAESAAREVVSLPMHPYLREAQQEEVVEAVLQAL